MAKKSNKGFDPFVDLVLVRDYPKPLKGGPTILFRIDLNIEIDADDFAPLDKALLDDEMGIVHDIVVRNMTSGQKGGRARNVVRAALGIAPKKPRSRRQK